MDVERADETARGVALGVLGLEGLRFGERDEALDGSLGAAEQELRRRFAGRKPGQIDELAPARRLYRAAGIDPTRHRPSSEALVRRVLKGGTLPRILPPVDLANLAAVTYFLPLGLYDAARLRGPVRLRLGRAGEGYAGIRKDRVNLEGRLCLEDDEGPFGNPSSDSARTAVGPATRDLLWIVFAPGDYPRERMAAHLAWSRERALERFGGRAVESLAGGA